jgi:hypothetical protein
MRQPSAISRQLNRHQLADVLEGNPSEVLHY